ncbi:MAG TPA: hypothetical protein VN368_02725 [Candidatus Methylomirabilis sp.]|nr:hypothetical protein [Candidatus Methylomirabilis sp.]
MLCKTCYEEGTNGTCKHHFTFAYTKRRLQDAEQLINHALDLMPIEQLDQWTGVRAFIEENSI